MDASQPSLPDDDWLRHIETILNSSNYRSLSIDNPFKFLDHDIHAKFTTDTAPFTAENIYSQSNLNNTTKTAADTTARLTLALLMNAVESSYSQSNPNNATEVAMDTTKPAAPLTAETTYPQFSLSNTPNNANTTQSNIQSWVDAANAALSTVETSHLNDNTPDTTEPATSAPESTSLSTINTIHPQIQTNGIGPATSATQSIRHSLNSTNLSQMTHLISSKTSITVHIYLASSWIEIPSLHSIFWNINVPSTWI
ncbi:hypothetical protein F5051DRAFT_431793, partial [Lentinula edodes]